jgi:multidrug efflux pump subunit AcrB
MWLVLGALRRPITVLVAALAVAIAAGLAIKKAPVDIFPDLGVPVVYVVQPYGGMSPAQMEGQIVQYYEYHFLYVAGLEHIESQSIQGMAMLKLYFHPGTDIAQSLAQVVAMAFRATSFMPPGTLPPFIVRFDAGSIPVGQLVFSSDTRNDQEIQDLALYRVRPLLATLPGVSAPPPSGGKVRTIVVYADPERMRATRISPDEIATTLAKENLTVPAGNVHVGGRTVIASTNAMVARPADLGNIPLRTGAGPTVLLRDVARVEDGADVVYNIALVNGRRTVYMPLTKRSDASTLDVVNGIKAALPRMRALVPEDIHLSLEFDQSVTVTNAIKGLLTEGALGAILTSLVVLLFLGSWRSALIVILTIPFSLLFAVVALRLTGQTINIMTLGGLALAVGILVDEATVAIENIHTHLGRRERSHAIVNAMAEVMQPRFLAMLCVLAVFIPSFFLLGIGRSLFPPLALAVGFSMIGSYLLSSMFVPVLATWLLSKQEPHADSRFFVRVRERYGALAGWTLRFRWVLIPVYLVACGLLLLLSRRIGTELFPRAQARQFQLRIRAPDGTELEKTEQLVRDTDAVIREEAFGKVNITLANIGNPPWTYPVNGIYVWNSGPHEALLLVELQKGATKDLDGLEQALREKLSARFPGVRFSFEAGDLVSQVLNFGAPTPISVSVSGNDMAQTRAFAERIAEALRGVDVLRDVQIPVALDYPTLDVRIDRERAGQLGVSVDRVARSIVAATSSSALVTPSFWVNPATGVPYRVAVRVPEAQMRSGEALGNLPVMQDGSARPLVSDVATISEGTAMGEYDHYNNQRTLTVTANLAGNDLGTAARAVQEALKKLGPPPRGSSVAIHGQAEQLELALGSLQVGILLAALVVLLLLAANFQSFREALVTLSTAPAVIAGVIVSLWLTRSTLNVQSMMGAIMALGVSVANAVLIVTFAHDQRRAGSDGAKAATEAASARLRPIVMTTIAMVAGMLPMALGLGEGGEQNAPLGRAVIGGLIASTFAALLVLPAVYAAVWGKAAYASASLDPDDPERLEGARGTA